MYLMKYLSALLFFIPVAGTVNGQQEVWTAYWNADTTLYGFKNSAGQVMIAPRFAGAGVARKLEYIMSVVEQVPAMGQWSYYFLTRLGKKTGIDSLYFFDNAPDCESEGFIRFRDHQRDKVGLLNRNGDVVIPAEYNYLDRVQNGLLTGLTGALKKSDGEHYHWEGGERLLLDTSGNILIRSFNAPLSINLYSVQKSETPSEHPDRVGYRSGDGLYYSFIDYEKEFANWLNHLLARLSIDTLKQHVFGSVSYYTEKEGLVFSDGPAFINKNYPVLKAILQKLQQASFNSFITRNGLNPFIHESGRYEKYFDNCNQAKEWKYPEMGIYFNQYSNKKLEYQEGLNFLRTDEGYQLIHVNIKESRLR